MKENKEQSSVNVFCKERFSLPRQLSLLKSQLNVLQVQMLYDKKRK